MTLADAYALHNTRLTNYCATLMRSREDGEDAAQETWVRAWRGWAEFKGDSALYTWLHSIARNTALERLRRAGAAKRRGSCPLDDAVAASVAVRDGALESTPDRLLLDAVLAKLPARQRAVLTLRYLYGLTEEETAQRVGISVSACKYRLRVAKTQLRRRVTQ